MYTCRYGATLPVWLQRQARWLIKATMTLPALPAEVDMERDRTCSRQEPQPACACSSSGCELSPWRP